MAPPAACEGAAGPRPAPRRRGPGRAGPAPRPRPPGRLRELGHESVEGLAMGPEVLLAQLDQRTLREPLAAGDVLHVLVHVEETGEQTAAGAALLDEPHGTQA